MKSVLATKYFLFVTIVTLIAHHNAWISGQLNALVDKVVADDIEGTVIIVLQWLTKAITIGLLFKVTAYFYDRYIWKFFFPDFDISGTWEYKNSYSDGRDDTGGTIIIKQTPYTVEMTAGSSSTDNPYHSRFISTSVKFSEHPGKLIASYIVDRYAAKDSSKIARKRSVVELEIVERKKVFLFGDRPLKMTGEFFNCVLPENEKAKLKTFNLEPWDSTHGTCSYKKVEGT